MMCMSLTATLNHSYIEVRKGDQLTIQSDVQTSSPIRNFSWTVNRFIKVVSQSVNHIVLNFSEVGTFKIKYRIENENNEVSEAECTIVVLAEQNKSIGLSLFIETDDEQQIPVTQSFIINQYNINTHNIKLMFRNTGGSTWKREVFEVVFGHPHFVFYDGMTYHRADFSIKPGEDYVIRTVMFIGGEIVSATIKATAIDEDNHQITKYFELRWDKSEEQDPLTLFEVKDDNYKLPGFVKRNARYRGPRESEKYLLGHQEQIYDIRRNYLDIVSQTEKLQTNINKWFVGELEEKPEITTIALEKTFDAKLNQSSYLLIPGIRSGDFQDIVVRLNGKEIPRLSRLESNFSNEVRILLDPTSSSSSARTLSAPKESVLPGDGFTIVNGYLILGQNVLEEGILEVSFTVTLELKNQHIYGYYLLSQKLQELDCRIGEIERRFTLYENAYK